MHKLKAIFFSMILLIVNTGGDICLAGGTGACAIKKLRFERISVDNGLSESGALCMLQDRRGFLWIGTYDGLNRYDGYEFVVYKPDPENPHSISDTGVRALYEDRSGRIWIGTSDGGLNVYDARSGWFKNYQADPDRPDGISNNEVRAILEDSEGTLWVGTRNGLNVFDPERETFRVYKHDPRNPASLCAGCVNVLYESPDKVLWIGTETGLSRYDRDTNSFINIRQLPNDPLAPQSIGGQNVKCLYYESPGYLWIGTTRPGLSRLDLSSGNITHYLGSCDVYVIHQDQSQIFWIGTDKGLARRTITGYESDIEPSYRFHFDTNNPYDSESLSQNTVVSMLEDQGGILWFGTVGGGLSKLCPGVQAFSLMRREPENRASLSGNHVSAMCESMDGILWVGTYKNGLNRVDRRTGAVQRIPLSDLIPASPQGNIVRYLMMDRQGDLWMGTAKTGLVHMSPDLEQVRVFSHNVNDPESLSEDNVYFVFEDSRGVIWVGTGSKGLNRLDKERGKFVRYQNDPKAPQTISHNRVRHIFEGSDGHLWIGTNLGLNRYDYQSGLFNHYEHDPKDPRSISHNRVTPILEGENQVLWVGTDMGLNRFDPRTETFKRYTVRDGLENDSIQAMCRDERGRLWMGTFKGISMLDPKTGEIRNYNDRDGLQGPEFWFNAGYQNSRGEIFFGGLNGLNIFSPEEVKINSHQPPVVITQFKVMNQARPLQPTLDGHQSVSLAYTDLFFSFTFAGLDYAAPEENHYQYRLDGFDQDWVDIGHSRTAVYTNINPGKYEFRVKAANNDGVWNEIDSGIRITIMPPYWRTVWFKTLLAVSFLALLLGLYTYRVRSLKAQQERLESLVDERTSELKDEIEERKQIETALQESRDYLEERVIERTESLRQMTSELAMAEERERRVIAANIHDNICQNLILSEIKLKQMIKGDIPPKELPLMTETAELINKISLDLRSLMVELSPPILYDLGLQAALEWLADQFYRKYHIRIEFIRTDDHYPSINDDLKILLFRSVRELLFNVVKHAQADNITITMSGDPTVITIHVQDNGQGFDVSQWEQSGHKRLNYGLMSVRERLLANGGRLVIESEAGKGTKATMMVPVRP